MSEEKQIEYKFLSDEPVASDDFGSHEKIANALERIIKKESGNKAIALQGGWGSGKSTVINILKSKLLNNKNVEVFVFDAWAYKDNLLRRTFLERLITYFTESSDIAWLNTKKREKWKNKKEELEKLVEVTKTTPIPNPTRWGIFAILTLGLFCIGTALISSSGPFKPLRFWQDEFGDISWNVTLGLVLCITPAFLIFLALIYYYIFKRDKDSIKKFITIFITAQEVETHSKTIKTPEPTSLEFQKYFTDLMQDLLEIEERKFVLVVDNLDRIDPEDAKNVWATMRTFFEKNDVEWINRFWLLVPFDPDALNRLWRRDEKENKKENRKENLSDSFKDKTFQIIFRIPPPILSSTKSYFKKQIEKAFYNFNDKYEIHSIYLLFNKKVITNERPVSPRDVIVFINKLVASFSQWGVDVPIRIQALYIIYEEELKADFDKKINAEDFFDSNILDIIDADDCYKYLAALHYNVPVDSALHVAYGKEIEEALTNGNGEKLKELCPKIPGIEDVCEHIIQDNYRDWATAVPQYIALSALALSTLKDKYVLNIIWKIFSKATECVKTWPTFNYKVGSGLSLIVKNTKEEIIDRLIRKILISLKNSIPDYDEEDKKEKIKDWTEGTKDVLKEIIRRGKEGLIKENFILCRNPEFYIDLLLELSTQKIPNYIIFYYLNQVKLNDLDQELANRCSSGFYSYEYVDVVKIIYNLNKNILFKSLISNINSKLQSGADVKSEEFSGYIHTLLLLRGKGNENAISIYSQLNKNGNILNHLFKAKSQNNKEGIALSIFCTLEIIPNGNPNSHVGNSSQGHHIYLGFLQNPENDPEILNLLIDIIKKYNAFEKCFDALDYNTEIKKLIDLFFKNIVEEKSVCKYFSQELSVEKYSFLKGNLDKDLLDQIYSQITENEKYVDLIIQKEFSIGDSEFFYFILPKVAEKKRKILIKFILNGIENTSSDDLYDLIREGSEIVNILKYFGEHKIIVSRSTSLQDALKKYARALIEEEIQILDVNWQSLLNCLKQSSYNTFIRDLLSIMRDKVEENDLTLILETFGKCIISSGLLCETKGVADDNIRRLFTPIIENQKINEINWMFDAIDSCPEIINKANKESIDDLKERIENAYQETEGETNSTLKKIAIKLGIDLKNSEK